MSFGQQFLGRIASHAERQRDICGAEPVCLCIDFGLHEDAALAVDDSRRSLE
jgi:hypothetical protein